MQEETEIIIQQPPDAPKVVRATKTVSRKYANSIIVDGVVVFLVLVIFVFKIFELVLPIANPFTEINLLLVFILLLDVCYRLWANFFIKFLMRYGDSGDFAVSTVVFIAQLIVLINKIQAFGYYKNPNEESVADSLIARTCNALVFLILLRLWRCRRLVKWYKGRKEEIKSQGDEAHSGDRLFNPSPVSPPASEQDNMNHSQPLCKPYAPSPSYNSPSQAPLGQMKMTKSYSDQAAPGNHTPSTPQALASVYSSTLKYPRASAPPENKPVIRTSGYIPNYFPPIQQQMAPNTRSLITSSASPHISVRKNQVTPSNSYNPPPVSYPPPAYSNDRPPQPHPLNQPVGSVLLHERSLPYPPPPASLVKKHMLEAPSPLISESHQAEAESSVVPDSPIGRARSSSSPSISKWGKLAFKSDKKKSKK